MIRLSTQDDKQWISLIFFTPASVVSERSMAIRANWRHNDQSSGTQPLSHVVPCRAGVRRVSNPNTECHTYITHTHARTRERAHTLMRTSSHTHTHTMHAPTHSYTHSTDARDMHSKINRNDLSDEIQAGDRGRGGETKWEQVAGESEDSCWRAGQRVHQPLRGSLRLISN